MDPRNGRPLYRCADAALVRAAPHAGMALPVWPDLTDDTPSHVARWCAWLREVWALDGVAEAVEHASPVLARQVEAVCAAPNPDARRARRTVLSMVRYLLRMTGRATPFGLFAGVAPAYFGSELSVRWGNGHRAVARADASWVTDVIVRLESRPELLARLPLMTTNVAFVRGDRLVVPDPPQSGGGVERPARVEVSLRYTTAVRIAVEAARSPIRCDELAGKLAAEFPTVPPSKAVALLRSLLEQRVLVSSLHAPSTVIDAFGYLLEELESIDAGGIPQAADLVGQLREIGEGLARHNRAPAASVGRSIRSAVARQMTAPSTEDRQSLAVDLRVDCSLVLPQRVAREAEAAASVLARLTAYPSGTTAWKDYHNRFFARYGIGSLVPLLDVVDPDVGLGFPAGYLGAGPEPREPVSARDQRLLALAQAAALEGRDEITLDERLVAELAVGDRSRVRVPPHMELCFQLHAESQTALRRGDFNLAVLSASRGVGTTTGRFIRLLAPSDQDRAAAVFERLPTSDPDPGTLPVQLSFPPLDLGDAHVTRAPRLLPAVISLAEHQAPGSTVIPVEDLAVGCDSQRLYLASLSQGRRLEPTALHALDLRAHTPPLARFLAEVGKAQVAVVTGFSWGTATRLPFLPRLRHGRVILSLARWRLDRCDLPGRGAPWQVWQDALSAWRARRRLPNVVLLTQRDQRLKLDLDQSAHSALLRRHLDSAEHALLTEAPAPTAYGWFGGRVHEIVVPMTAAQPSRWSALPPVSAAHVIGRDHGRLPGASTWLHAQLYGHPERQPEILAAHLPELLGEWAEPPAWWYTRYHDPEPHLRLRIALPDATGFGSAAQRVSAWAGRLRKAGLLREVQFATSYPETGRWGAGGLMAAAEEVFGADSRALLVQFAQPNRPHPQALAAANFTAIAGGFTGTAEAGMHWLIEHSRVKASPALDRTVLAESVRLADPADDWAALRAAPGGHAIAEAWAPRHRALTHYRTLLHEADGISPDAVLNSLLHAHHIRAIGIDKDHERTCLRLARAAALAWRARTSRSGE